MARPEFNTDDYPERLGCRVMPSIEDEVIEIEVVDAEENVHILTVPVAALRLLPPMPSLPQEMPEEAHKLIEGGVGLGMVACLIVERNDKAKLLRVSIPTRPNVVEITVPTERLVRVR